MSEKLPLSGDAIRAAPELARYLRGRISGHSVQDEKGGLEAAAAMLDAVADSKPPHPRTLGDRQRDMLRELIKHGGHWHAGCGWHWITARDTQRLLMPLVRRGLVTTTDDVNFDLTDAGREVMRRHSR